MALRVWGLLSDGSENIAVLSFLFTNSTRLGREGDSAFSPLLEGNLYPFGQ